LLEDDAIFGPGRQVVLSVAGKAELKTEIDSFRRQHGNCVVKLRGIETISEAGKYIGAEIRIPAADLPVPEKGFYYTFQLKGCRVITAEGEDIGTITDVLDSGGTQILKVDRENEETLIPFAQEYLRKIDVDRRRIEVDLPEDLRDLNK